MENNNIRLCNNCKQHGTNIFIVYNTSRFIHIVQLKKKSPYTVHCTHNKISRTVNGSIEYELKHCNFTSGLVLLILARFSLNVDIGRGGGEGDLKP